MDEYERLVRLSARLKDQMTKMAGLLAHDPLREAKNKVEMQISELLLAEAATVPAETPPSSLDTGNMEVPPNTNSISFETWRLVREVPTGAQTMATGTYPAFSSTPTVGDVLKVAQAILWTPSALAILASRRLSGSTPSATPVAPEAGRSAATPAPGACPACRVVHFRLHLAPPILCATTGGVR